MPGIVAQGKDAAMHGGMERFDPPAEHLRKACQLLDASNGQARFAQQTLSTTRRVDLETELFETAREIDDSRLVKDRNDGAQAARMLPRVPSAPRCAPAPRQRPERRAAADGALRSGFGRAAMRQCRC